MYLASETDGRNISLQSSGGYFFVLRKHKFTAVKKEKKVWGNQSFILVWKPCFLTTTKPNHSQLCLKNENHFLYVLQVLILFPYGTGTNPKEIMWNTTRSASLIMGGTTSLPEHNLTHYRSLWNIIQVCTQAALPAHSLFLCHLIHYSSQSFFIPRGIILKITLTHSCCSVPRSLPCFL